MRLAAPTYPLTASPRADTPELQAWCEWFGPIYRRAATASLPRMALRHERVRELERNQSHWPRLVRFYLDNPPVFEALLEHVLGGTVRGKTLRQRQQAWRVKVARAVGSSKPARLAAG